MRRSITVTRAGGFVAAAAAVALMTGCSTGQIAETAGKRPSVPGANVTVDTDNGRIALRNLLIAYAGPEGYAAGDAAELELRVFNETTREIRLTKVTAAGAAQVVQVGAATVESPAPSPSGDASPSAGESPTPDGSPSADDSPRPDGSPGAAETPAAPAGGPVNVTIPPLGVAVLTPETDNTLRVVGLTAPLAPGGAIPVTFEFSDGTVISEVMVPVGLPFTPAPRETMDLGGGH